jgi:ATP-dependent RNA helicase UAP56/SUB2
MNDHIKLLKGLKPPHIIVGTPGRVLALVKNKHLDFANLQILVFDECDKMLDQTGMFLQILALAYPYIS